MIQILNKLKKGTKGKLKSIHLSYVRRQHAFSSSQLQDLLVTLGIENGDVLLVHSSMEGFKAFDGKITDIISVLQRSVGSDGTLLMPTMPFTGTAVEYIQLGNIFNVKKTPSRMGMISELFRRMPGVSRSIHPTHPVAAWGLHANDLLEDHYKCTTPCGRQSPYGRLLDFNGKILLLGTSVGVLTFFHTVEEILEKDFPFSPFTEKKYSLQSKTESDELVTTEMRLFNPDVSKRRNISILIPELKSKGYWRESKLGTLDVILLNANDILNVMTTMSNNGKYCYD